MKKWTAIVTLGAAAAVLCSGCTLMPDHMETLAVSTEQTPEETSPQETEESGEETATSSVEVTLPEEESTTPIEIDVDMTTEPSTPEPIEELPLPTDEAGEWLDYQLASNIFDEIWPNDDDIEFHLNRFPLIYVKDFDTQKKINDVLEVYAKNRYSDRFQMLNIHFELDCDVMNQSRFVSYRIAGTIYHTGDDPRYEPQIPYRYYFTIDRMTGRIIDLETAIGIEKVMDALRNGRYEVVEANDSVLERFSDELLAMTYQETPMFEEDVTHELDFYLQDGYVNVVIWVGSENGSYAVFRILDEPNIR